MIRPTRRSILVKSSNVAVGVVMVFMVLFVEEIFRKPDRRIIGVKVAKYILIAGFLKFPQHITISVVCAIELTVPPCPTHLSLLFSLLTSRTCHRSGLYYCTGCPPTKYGLKAL